MKTNELGRSWPAGLALLLLLLPVPLGPRGSDLQAGPQVGAGEAAGEASEERQDDQERGGGEEGYFFQWRVTTWYGLHEFIGRGELCGGLSGNGHVQGSWPDGTQLVLDGNFVVGLPIVPEEPEPGGARVIGVNLPMTGEAIAPRDHHAQLKDNVALVITIDETKKTVAITGSSDGTGSGTWIHPPEEKLPPHTNPFKAVYPLIEIEEDLLSGKCVGEQ